MPRIRQKADVYRNEDFRRDVMVRLAYFGLKQNDLANHLGVCEATVSNMLHSPGKIPVDRMRLIISYLQLEPETILKLLGFPMKSIKEAVE